MGKRVGLGTGGRSGEVLGQRFSLSRFRSEGARPELGQFFGDLLKGGGLGGPGESRLGWNPAQVVWCTATF